LGGEGIGVMNKFNSSNTEITQPQETKKPKKRTKKASSSSSIPSIIIFNNFIGTSEIIEDNLRSSRLKSYKDPPKKRNRNMSRIKREHK